MGPESNTQLAKSKPLIQKIKKFLSNHSIMTISTMGKDQAPESAVVEYFLGEDLKLYFGTSRHFRKYHNLLENNHVSVVVGFYEEHTLQYEGIAQIVDNKDVNKNIKSKVLSRARQNDWIECDENYAYFEITPTWIRLTDVTQKPWRVFSINL